MGQGISLETSVEIAAPPSTVREVFLDFASYPSWASWRITPSDASRDPTALEKNDRLKTELPGMTFYPWVVHNTSESFAWIGTLPYVFTGTHVFTWSYINDASNPNITKMVQHEDFSGALAFLMGEGWSMRKNSLATWDKFFAELKGECERRNAAER